MQQGVKKESYYERQREERKKYQRQYREDHLEEVRKKDRERRRRTQPFTPLLVEHNVKVVFQ
jgi:hypothetical protein